MGASLSGGAKFKRVFKIEDYLDRNQIFIIPLCIAGLISIIMLFGFIIGNHVQLKYRDSKCETKDPDPIKCYIDSCRKSTNLIEGSTGLVSTYLIILILILLFLLVGYIKFKISCRIPECETPSTAVVAPAIPPRP